MQNLLASTPFNEALILISILAVALLAAIVAWNRGRRDLAALSQHKEQLKAELQGTNQTLALKSQEHSQACEHIEGLKSTHSNLEMEIHGHETTTATLREDNARLTGSEQSLRETKERLALDLDRTKANLTARERDLETLTKAMGREREESSAVKARLEARESELVTFKKRLEKSTAAEAAVAGTLETIREQSHQKELALKEARTELAARDEKLAEFAKAVSNLQGQLRAKVEEVEMYRSDTESQEKELEVTQNQLENQREKLAELKEQFEVQKKSLTDEFKSLSEVILKDRQKELQVTSKEGIQALLAPLKEEIGGFKKRVETVHSENQAGQGQLKEHLKTLKTMNSQLTQRAENLTNALRNDKKTLGNWGEIQVERLLENAGLDKNTYRREANFKTGEGANQRPDFIIDLPEEKCLIVDSKVSLNAYVDSVNATTEEERLAHLKQHTTNIRNHIKSLAGKGYDSLGGLNSPDFTFMFMPVESAYLAGFEEDASLFDFAYEKRVAVVTPNTLLPILKTVQSLWRIDRQNKSTEALAESAGKVHKKLMTFLEKFLDVEKKIDSLQSSFSGAKNVLNSGRGNLIRLAEDFEEQGVKVTKTIPVALRSLETA